MKSFIVLEWDAERCRQELEKFRDLLDKHDTLKEREHILPLFRNSHHLAGLIGFYHTAIAINHCDRIAFEYDLAGDFSCDLVVGNLAAHAYNFIEFEEAGKHSLFRRQGKKATREWSATFDHGCSQIIDWFGKLRHTEKSNDFEVRFGARLIDFMGTLVVGRDKFLEAGERQRLNYRRQHVIVDSRSIQCVTYDELLADLTFRLKQLEPKTSSPSSKFQPRPLNP